MVLVLRNAYRQILLIQTETFPSIYCVTIPVLGARKQRWTEHSLSLEICSQDAVMAKKSHNYNYVINVDR